MRVLAIVTLVLASSTPEMAAQQPAPAPGGAATVVVGTVFDSIRLRPMAGARVRVDSSDLVATVDAEGRFRIEGITVGQHQLRVEHPLLDTLGIALRSPVMNYEVGSAVNAELAIPASETLIGLFCTPAWRARGPAALVGKVREADSGTPATGAKVSVVWYEIDVRSGVRRAPRVREAQVGADGAYRICGLPAQLDGRVQVLRGPLTSGDINVNFGQDLLFLRSMSIANPATIAVVPGDSGVANAPRSVIGTARLVGKVLNHAGQPLAGARVQLDGTTRVAATRTGGDFVLDSLPAGTQTVTVRSLGYAPMEQAVDLSSSQPQTITLRLADFVPVLEEVRVTAAKERALDNIGFTRRKRSGMGHFMEGDAINTNALNFSDVVRVAPGIRIVPVMGRQMITSSRDINGCVAVWIDGTQWQQMEPGDIDDFVKPHELAAIEIFSPAQTPAEFQSTRTGSCTTLVAWTVRRLNRKR